MTPHVTLAALAAAVSIPCLTAQTSPADRDRFEGNASTSYPLGRWNARLQQLHADLGAARTLRGHGYRRDAHATSNVAAFQSELEVTASITTRTPDQASTRFTDQTGPNPAVVLPRIRLSFPATARPLGEPAPQFELVVPWQQPFSWTGQDVLCLDVVSFGNVTASGNDRNFTANLDAHEFFKDGRAEQPGYGYGTGCVTLGGRAPTLAADMIRTPADLKLQFDAQCRLPSDQNGPALAWLLIGALPDKTGLPNLPGCSLWARADLVLPLGQLDASGRTTGGFGGIAPFPDGTQAFLQTLAWRAGDQQLAATPGIMVTVPPLAPAKPPVARISAADDRTAATGTVATIGTVTRFW